MRAFCRGALRKCVREEGDEGDEGGKKWGQATSYLTKVTKEFGDRSSNSKVRGTAHLDRVRDRRSAVAMRSTTSKHVGGERGRSNHPESHPIQNSVRPFTDSRKNNPSVINKLARPRLDIRETAAMLRTVTQSNAKRFILDRTTRRRPKPGNGQKTKNLPDPAKSCNRRHQSLKQNNL